MESPFQNPFFTILTEKNGYDIIINLKIINTLKCVSALHWIYFTKD